MKDRLTILQSVDNDLSGFTDPQGSQALIPEFLKKDPTVLLKTFPHFFEQKVLLTAAESLHFKIIRGFFWNQLQKICRFLNKKSKSLNFLAPEGPMRANSNVATLKRKMNFENLVVRTKDEEKSVPIHWASSFYDFFVEAFNIVKANGLFIEHPGFNKKIWVALAGDKDGRITKFCIFISKCQKT